MGFYIEELPTELNGITMEEADYLADEFLKDTPCNRMWDAMRALRDFYETVTSEAVVVADRKTKNSSEIPNNCEHITEDGVTCARYPACDDCHSNPLNKVKGSERLVKGTEQTEPQYSEDDMYWLSLAEDVASGKISDAGANQSWLEYINHKDEPTISKMEQVDEPQTDCAWGRTE